MPRGSRRAITRDFESSDSEGYEASVKQESPEKVKLESNGESNGVDSSPADVKTEPSNGKPHLLMDLPSKTEEALSTFTPLDECTFSSKSLGWSGQDEAMTCDCRESVTDGVNHACGDDSDCINRLTSIECTNDKCTCGDDCRNQRFQRGEYANIDVILTTKKGYGVRALEDIPQGTFIYEYIGEVVDENRFLKRMETYKSQGIKHFYFMMLQKGEFIDATAKGCLARFCNHSCKPNSFVDKWVVGDKLRMGIFSKRAIAKGEEITFDYNVDRYGTQAQPCYCGEDNCVGVLGGKTQTEAAALRLPDLLIDALDLDEDDEKMWRGIASKQRKGSKANFEELQEEFAKSLPAKPIEEESVSKLMGCLIQCRDLWLIEKLVTRIHLTTDTNVHSRVMRMHGYQIFSVLLREHRKIESMVVMLLEILTRWPRLTKNKISSSKIESTVQELADSSEYDDVKSVAASLLSEWSSLQMAYRIPRRERSQPKSPSSTEPETKEQIKTEVKLEPVKVEDDKEESRSPVSTPKPATAPKSATPKLAATDKKSKKDKVKLPPGWESSMAPNGHVYYFNRKLGQTTWEVPQDTGSPRTPKVDKQKKTALRAEEQKDRQEKSQQKMEVQKIIEQAREEQEKQMQQKMADLQKIIHSAKSNGKAKEGKEPRVKESKAKETRSSEANGDSSPDKSKAGPEKALTKAFAKFVPNIVARYEKQVGHENVKQFSKDIVHILVSKELRSEHPATDGDLSEAKKKKIKLFIKSYMEKAVAKYEAKKSRHDEAKAAKRSGESEEGRSAKKSRAR